MQMNEIIRLSVGADDEVLQNNQGMEWVSRGPMMDFNKLIQ